LPFQKKKKKVCSYQELSIQYCVIPWTVFDSEDEKPPSLKAVYQSQVHQVPHAVKMQHLLSPKIEIWMRNQSNEDKPQTIRK